MPISPLLYALFAKPALRHGIFAALVLLFAGTVMAQSMDEEAIAAANPVVGVDPAHQQSTSGQGGDNVTSGTRTSARNPARVYKKSVLLTRFQVANSLQVEDIADIWDGYPLELLHRLEIKGNVVARHSTASPFPDPHNLNPDAPASRELIRSIAEQNGSQLVISGFILDAAVSGESLRPYFGWQGGETGRRFELGLPWNSVVAGIRPVASERRLDVVILIHDGRTGALLNSHRNSAEISGRVAVGRNKAFASAAFFDTPFGQAVERLLNAQIELIDDDLASLPFTANIVRIEDGKVFIDAGSLSALRPGDRLRVYHRNPTALIENPAKAALGIPESPVATLTLSQVQTLFAMGELSGDPAKSRVISGDIVRVEPVRRNPPR